VTDLALFGVLCLYVGIWDTAKSLHKWYYWIKLGKLPANPDFNFRSATTTQVNMLTPSPDKHDTSANLDRTESNLL
jgi:hypothetical protein